MNLSFNNLEGEVPTKGIFGNASAIFVNGNDKLCGGIVELHLPACTNHGSTEGEKSNAFRIVLAIIGAVLGFLLISSYLTLYWIRRSKSRPPSPSLIGDQFLKLSYKELFQATGGFSSTNFLGSGSFGSVYKGIINQGETIVAVKVLNLQNPRAYKSFTAECEALRNIWHPNLVKILTACSSLDSKDKGFKALVYEFMPNGSLDDWLHLPMEANNHSRSLGLLQRLNIAIDVASALDYLHYHCYAAIVHCDLKPSNILLDSDMTAHVSDFGLARLLLDHDDNSSQAQTSTIEIKGSIGYAAPEYGMGGRATIEGDVFSYGILLLEMFTGKRPTDQMFADDLNLHNFAKAALPVNIMQILDPTLLPKEEHAYKSFTVECEALRNIRHRNLVKILTSCSSLDSKGEDFKALVYEFMPNGSLDDWLHLSVEVHNHSRNLSILQRLNITIDVASALDYLHYNCDVPIVHCDLKPSNVLLDSNMVAHVSDFGLARLLLEPDDNSSQAQTGTIGIKGSIGYAAPEYGMGGRATIQGDVFSYGILLLEMFTGKRPTDQMFINDLNLHSFTKAALPVNVMQVLDPILLPKEEQREEIEEGAINRPEGPSHMIDKLQDCITSIIEIALQCSMELPRERMQMNDVVRKLHLIKENFLQT
ncbi:probable LRR receptor-like serine/threonine-protein kinase At3g47570 [Telopea speciosissima]|uniref:probable LRR receptor-like serine/threonine-protein kinase At3g47570 n=1 Tax=Telopea speciosissima TaxID=54955 RepID=UPI001CC3C72F|nr:probable LRR receptor-like serine/threonine-protein kinase At3g47570 [Telopea speciosissima]